MNSTNATDLGALVPALRRWLKQHGDTESTALTAPQLRLLLDELARLGQSSDRLRRQNRRLRLRLQRAGGEVEPEPADDGGDGVPDRDDLAGDVQ